MNKTKGISAVMIAAIIYGFTPILGKFTYLEGSNTMSLTFYRSLLSLPIIYAILKAKKVSLSVTKSEFMKLTILGILGPSITALMLYGAYNYISVGMSTTLHYIYPVLVTAVCIIIFKEKISKEKIIAVILSTIGVALFFDGDFTKNIIGILLALISGLTYGTHILFMDKSGIKGMYPFKFTFYACLTSSVFLFIVGIATKSLVFYMSPIGWFYTLLVSILVSVFANALMPVAINNVGSTVTSIVGMFEPITSVIFGILFLQEAITFKNTMGIAAIITAVLLLTLSKENKTEINTLQQK